MLHHFFGIHGLGEENVHLYMDNCGGQNKNNAMVGYLLWHVLTGLHKNITLSFMVTGHMKFSPDWCFGLLKKRYTTINQRISMFIHVFWTSLSMWISAYVDSWATRPG